MCEVTPDMPIADGMQEFDPFAHGRPALRKRAKELCTKLNAMPVQPNGPRKALLQQLFAQVGKDGDGVAYIEADFFCDYGKQISIGEGFFANHHCIMLDAAAITIGDRVMFGPAVHLYTTTHPLDAKLRAQGMQWAAPISIGDDCWIGGQTVIMPGVAIGAGTVIGAGSVVTHSIPAGVVAFGNPCRVVKSLP